LKKSLDERIQELELMVEQQQKELLSVKRELDRVSAARECENLINKLEHYAETNRWEQLANLFALKTPGVRVEEFGNPGYEGGEAVWKRWTVGHASAWHPGFMCINTTTTTVIEVAEDCQSAKMAFISPGVETSEWEGKWQAYWIWAKLGIDFIKEDGQWKIWHYHVYGLFCTQYERPWTDLNQKSPMMIPYEELEKRFKEGNATFIKPNIKPTHPAWWWRPDVCNDTVPAPPENYKTFDIKESY
jgi:hypothetical protein